MAKDPQKVGERKAYGDRRRDDYTTKSNQRKLKRKIKRLNRATSKLDPEGAKEVRYRSGASYVNASKMSADAKDAEAKAVSRGADREDISARKRSSCQESSKEVAEGHRSHWKGWSRHQKKKERGQEGEYQNQPS